MNFKDEAIVLRSQDYKERDRLVTLFSKESGILSLIVKGITKKKRFLLNLTTPLCHGEFLYRKGKSDLYTFVDGSPINMHLSIRQSYDHLQAAGQKIQAILKTQWPGKAAPQLYALFLSFLKNLGTSTSPETFQASFYLKLLKHEGLLHLHKQCSNCRAAATHLQHGESLCQSCASHTAMHLTPHEWKVLHILMNIRRFSAINTLPLNAAMIQSVDTLFKQLTDHT